MGKFSEGRKSSAGLHMCRATISPISLESRTATSQNVGEEAGLVAPRGLDVGKQTVKKKKKLSQSKQLFVRRGLHTRTHTVFQFRWNPFSRVAARSLSLSRASDE